MDRRAWQATGHQVTKSYTWLSNRAVFLGGVSGKEPTCPCRRHKRSGFHPWVRKMPWRRAWQPTPVFLPGKSHGRRSLAGYGPQGWKGSDRTEWAHAGTQVIKQHPRAGTKSDHLLLFWPRQLCSLQLQLLRTGLGCVIQHHPSSFPTLILSRVIPFSFSISFHAHMCHFPPLTHSLTRL